MDVHLEENLISSPHRCPVEGCQRVFHEQETLLQHQSRHIQCGSCLKRFKTKAKFKNHLRYNGSKRCRSKFKQSLTESDTSIVKRTSNNEAYVCDFYCKTCSFKTKYIKNIKRHCNFSCKSPAEPTIISNNSRTNSRKQSLYTDKSSHHEEAGNNDAYTCSYSCKSCIFKANSVEIIISHCDSHRDQTDYVLFDESTSNTISINAPSIISNEDCFFENDIYNVTEECQQIVSYQCDTCGEEGKNARQYRRHIKNGCKFNVPDTLDLNKVTFLNCICQDNSHQQILDRISPADKIDLCTVLKSAVPNVFPLLCRKVKSMGHFKVYPKLENGVLLKSYLLEKPAIVIPKHIIISCQEKKAYFGPYMTKIPNRVLKTYRLNEEEFDSHYVITLKRNEPLLCNFDRIGTDDHDLYDNRRIMLPLHESTQIEDIDMTDDEDSSQDSSDLHSQTRDNEDNSQQSSVLPSQTRYIEDNSQNSSFLDCQTKDDEYSTPNFIDEYSQEEDFDRGGTDYNTHGSNNDNNVQEDFDRDDTEYNTHGSNDNNIDEEDFDRDNTDYNTHGSNDDNILEEDLDRDDIDYNTHGSNGDNSQEEDNERGDANNNETEENQDNTLPREKFRYMNIFLHPEEASSEDINNLIHCTKTQFLEYAESLRPYQTKINRGRKSKLSLYSHAFLFRLKIASNLSFKKLATLFVIGKSTALRIYNNILGVSYQFLSSIPNVLKGDEEVEKLYKGAYEAMDPFYKKLFEPFSDPKGLGRKPVVFCIDATYQETMKSADNSNNKTFFYSPYHQHVIKLMIICTPEPKVVYVLPACASESPASGDGNLLGNHVRMQAHTEKEALKILAEGTAEFFPIFVCDTGFQLTGRIKTPEDRYSDFRQVVEDAGGIFLGTKKEEYLLRRDKTTGEIHKVPFDERLLTAIDTAIKES